MKRKNGIIIAMDGPAGVGKSSVGEKFAERIKYRFLSTGQMYRALAWKASGLGVSFEDGAAIGKLAEESLWGFDFSGTVIRIILDGRVMEPSVLGDEDVGRATSAIAKLPEVRKFMCLKQREIGADGGIVMEGRDIGSNVFPDAEMKIYLDASAEERARRRVKQLLAEKKRADFPEILSAILKRDRQDAERKYNPLMKTKDYNVVDTTFLSREEVLEKLVNLFNERMKSLEDEKVR